VRVRFPEPGAYRLLLFAGPAEQRTTQNVAELGFVPSESVDLIFLTTYRDYDTGRACLVTPQEMPDGLQRVPVVVRVPGAHDVAVDTPEVRWQRLEPRRDGFWMGRVTIDPSQPALLAVKHGGDDAEWDHLVRWPMVWD